RAAEPRWSRSEIDAADAGEHRRGGLRAGPHASPVPAVEEGGGESEGDPGYAQRPEGVQEGEHRAVVASRAGDTGVFCSEASPGNDGWRLAVLSEGARS